MKKLFISLCILVVVAIGDIRLTLGQPNDPASYLSNASSMNRPAALRWGDFKADHCTGIGSRQYSAILWDIPWGRSWEAACASMPADINGHHFDSPTRCVNTGTNMWGEFDVPDSSCQPNWGEFKRDHCTAMGRRQYSSVLWNIPGGVSWEAACANMSADINGHHFNSPARCVNTGTNMWGEFDVPDGSCPNWGNAKKDQCTGWGKRQYSSILWDIPAGVSWEWACKNQGATIAGQSFSQPARCVNTGTNIWGEFDVDDSTCAPHWGDFKKDHCTNTGKRQYSAIIYDPPPGVSWEEACASTPAVIEGQHIAAPAKCVKTDIAGIGLQMWGEFDVDDATCASVTECPGCRPVMTGFADLHNHQFANLAFGGKAIVGEAFGPIRTALPHCDYKDGNPLDWVHGPGGTRDNFGAILGVLDFVQGLPPGHLVGGYPEFDGWPRWNNFTHQAMYEDWLQRAHQGGLKLMVMLAVNNEFACSLIEKALGRTCNDMEAVDLQIAAAKQMEAYIDNKSGGPGKGWYRIVYSPQEARAAISQGQLAVVLGIEVDSLFNCSLRASCTPEYVSQELERYYEMGVRHLFPIHFYDNGFGGSAISNDLIAKRTVNPPLTRDCKAEGYTYNGGRCNARGLTDLGKFLIRAMISKGMIIDIDHMSALSFNDALDIAEAFKYPVVSSHTGFIDISKGNKNHEGNLKAEQVERIRKLEGMVALILHQGKINEIDTYRGSGSTVIDHTCAGTSETWAQAYLYAIEKMNGAPVGIGTDFNGGIIQTGPRFGPESCPGNRILEIPEIGVGIVGPNNPVVYPFVSEATGATMERSTVGKKTFSINEDGLAHVGMLPDFIADLQALGLTNEDLSPLLNSAEGYIQVWERTESHKAPFFPTGSAAQGDDMQPNEVLNPGQLIKSANGEYTFVYQNDGNLVLYQKDGTPLWASDTYGSSPGVCIMQSDGNLVIYDANGKPIWSSDTWLSPGSGLVVQDDGNVVIYQPDGTLIWATNTVQP